MESHQLKHRAVSANEEVRSHDRDVTDLARLVLANIRHPIHPRVQLHNSCHMGGIVQV
jgi:hypothetical protein